MNILDTPYNPSKVNITGGAVGDVAVGSLRRRYSPAWLLLVRLRATIIGNGGTVDERDLLALRDPLDALVRSTAWPKIVELWVPVGNGLTAALCKIKGTVLTMGHNNMVDADYSRWLGLKGNGTNKDVVTNFNSSTLTAGWGCGVYPTGALSGSDVLMGDLGNTYIGYGGGQAKINGSPNMPLDRANRFMAVQNVAGVGASCHYCGHQANVATAGATNNSASMYLLSYNGGFFSANSIGGYAAWAPSLTKAELKAVGLFFESASYRLGRLGVLGSIVSAGDSNTQGVGVTATDRWTAKLAALMGATEVNQGIGGYTMSDNDDGNASGRYIATEKTRRSVNGGVYLTVQLGTNDDRRAVSLANFKEDYEAWLNIQLDMGWLPGNVVLIAPVAATDPLSNATRQQQMRDVIKQLASKYRCLYVDAWALTNGNPAHFQGDSLHLSVAGHTALAGAVQSAICGDAYAGALPF